MARNDIRAECDMIVWHHQWGANNLDKGDPLAIAAGGLVQVGNVKPVEVRMGKLPVCPTCKVNPRPWQASHNRFGGYCRECMAAAHRAYKARAQA